MAQVQKTAVNKAFTKRLPLIYREIGEKRFPINESRANKLDVSTNLNKYQMKKAVIPIIAVLLFIIASCNKSDNVVNNNNGGSQQNDSCGFGILTVVNNSWNIYRVEVDSVLYFSVNFKSSNGGSIPLGNHNIRVGVPQNYVLDTMLFVKDCIAYTFYCQ